MITKLCTSVPIATKQHKSAPAKKRLTSEERKNIVITQFQKDCLVGHLLGDGYITRSIGASSINHEKTNARFGFTQSTKKIEYFENVFNNFKTLCAQTTQEIGPTTKYFNTAGTELSSINFSTMRLPCFNIYYEMFYNTYDKSSIKSNRQVPLNIMEHLTPVSLSY